MTEPESDSELLTPHQASAAWSVFGKAVTLVAVVVGLLGGLVEVGAWKGRLEEKVEHVTGQVEKQEPRLIAVEASTHEIKQDLEAFREENKQFREDLTKRADHQMERLNSIADRVGAKPAR